MCERPHVRNCSLALRRKRVTGVRRRQARGQDSWATNLGWWQQTIGRSVLHRSGKVGWLKSALTHANVLRRQQPDRERVHRFSMAVPTHYQVKLGSMLERRIRAIEMGDRFFDRARFLLEQFALLEKGRDQFSTFSYFARLVRSPGRRIVPTSLRRSPPRGQVETRFVRLDTKVKANVSRPFQPHCLTDR